MNKKWKEYKFILYDSSLLTWYADVKHKKPDGMVLLKVIFFSDIFFKFNHFIIRMLSDLFVLVHIRGNFENIHF